MIGMSTFHFENILSNVINIIFLSLLFSRSTSFPLPCNGIPVWKNGRLLEGKDDWLPVSIHAKFKDSTSMQTSCLGRTICLSRISLHQWSSLTTMKTLQKKSSWEWNMPTASPLTSLPGIITFRKVRNTFIAYKKVNVKVFFHVLRHIGWYVSMLS